MQLLLQSCLQQMFLNSDISKVTLSHFVTLQKLEKRFFSTSDKLQTVYKLQVFGPSAWDFIIWMLLPDYSGMEFISTGINWQFYPIIWQHSNLFICYCIILCAQRICNNNECAWRYAIANECLWMICKNVHKGFAITMNVHEDTQ